MYQQQLTKIFKKPFYCGVITHGMLEGKVVEEKHEPIISKEIFLRVNNIHQQSANYGVPHKKENEELPLKVFVKCGDCKQPFTGYLMKAKGIYYYKCRTTGCRCNKNANELNTAFANEFKTSIQYELESFFYEVSKDSFEQQAVLKKQLTEINNKIDSLQESLGV